MNVSELSANIKALDLSGNFVASEAERDYFKFYGLNFESQFPQIKHHFGHLACGRFNIVSHYYENKNASETCFIVHGYYDHSGLYNHVIEYCLKKNFSVVIFDLPGHGLSTGEPVSIESFSEYQIVLKNIVDFFEDSAPKPWHAIGQSTGGAILMDFLLTENERPTDNVFDEPETVFIKTVLLAPLVRPEIWLLARAGYWLGRLFLKKVRRKFVVNSHDKNFLDFLKNSDPLQSHYLSVKWVGALLKWIPYFHQLLPSKYSPLIVQGKKDHTVDWPYNTKLIKQKFPSSTIFCLNEAGHQLVNESENFRQSMFSAMDIYFGS